MLSRTIKQWSVVSGLSEVYIRRMVLKGVIKTTKVEIAKNTFRHEITQEEFETFRATRNNTKREDGRNKFVLYGNLEEIKKVQELLQSNNIEAIIQKPKQYKVTK